MHAVLQAAMKMTIIHQSAYNANFAAATHSPKLFYPLHIVHTNIKDLTEQKPTYKTHISFEILERKQDTYDVFSFLYFNFFF